ncbi:MAG TPA: DUF3574 domain-containing protein [Rhizomicrobium sp.]|jgi:hypothetical protein
MLRTLPILLLLIAAPVFARDCKPPARSMARTELLFGAGQVSESAWHRFLSKEVTPRFPDGLTALEGYGQWKADNGAITKERSRMLLIWHTPDAKADTALDAIRDAYKKQFHQQSVMRVDGEDCVSF